MEYVKCPSCNNETPQVLSRCKHCGERLQQRTTITDTERYNKKSRAGFTTFYLWLGWVLSSLIGLAYFATIFTRKGLWSANDPMWSRVFGFITSAILVFGYLFLIRWRKYGFYILVLMGFVSLAITFLNGGDITFATFFPLISMFILFAVLQIKKDGKSCWEQLT